MNLCVNCENKFSSYRNKAIFCSKSCEKDFQYKIKIKNWKEGNLSGYSGVTVKLCNFIRKYLLLKYNNTCQKCGWNELHPLDNKPLVEINHIDGNAENCREDNLEVLCPNCHSKTYNFRNRNKNSKRVR